MKLTIFTPTYNRGQELQGLWESICKSLEGIKEQDSVEWLIVDDGSSISISNYIAKFHSKNNLDVVFIRKNNGGKHTAFNLAIEKCTGDIFVCVDDDDRLTPNALNDIFTYCKKYKNMNYGAVVGRVVNSNGKLLGSTIFQDELVSNTIEIRDKYHFWGEPEVYFTKYLRQFKFPVFEKEKFLTEAFVFDQMSTKYPFIYTNSKWMIKRYLKGGLTDNQLLVRINSPIGSESYYNQRKKLCSGMKNQLKATINRQRFAIYIEKKDRPSRKIDHLEILAAPITLFIFIHDRLYLKAKERRSK